MLYYAGYRISSAHDIAAVGASLPCVGTCGSEQGLSHERRNRATAPDSGLNARYRACAPSNYGKHVRATVSRVNRNFLADELLVLDARED